MTGPTTAVSRETAEPVELGLPDPPEAARLLFGDRMPVVQAYAELLAGAGVTRGLIGPREVPRLWERHLLNCAAVSEIIAPDSVVDDVGSGAGLPGLVLAIHRPDLQLTLVEPLLRRSTFLAEAVAELGLSNVDVVRQRAEERAASWRAVDVVTARAVAPLERLVTWCLPLLKPGGVLLALKGASADAELTSAARTLRRLGVVDAEVVRVGAALVDPPTTVVRLRRPELKEGRSPRKSAAHGSGAGRGTR